MTGYTSSGSTIWLSRDFCTPLYDLTKQKPMTPFEIKVTIPISKTDIFENTAGCSRQEVGIVSVEKAKAIRDAINRQLAGLKATAPKLKTRPDRKKPSTKKRK